MSTNPEWLPEDTEAAPDPRQTDNGWHPGDPETEADQTPEPDVDEEA